MDELDITDDKLCLGAEAIAREIFNGALSPKQIYRLADKGGWPIFKVQGKLAARPAACRREICRREAEALAGGSDP
jgi:hypothetical protein